MTPQEAKQIHDRYEKYQAINKAIKGIEAISAPINALDWGARENSVYVIDAFEPDEIKTALLEILNRKKNDFTFNPDS